MEAKHTPGPWYPLPGRHNISIRYKTGDKDLPMINVASVRGQYSDGCPYGTSEGNARLILASPELLAIAMEARALLERGPDTTEAEREDVWRGLSEVISKATQ